MRLLFLCTHNRCRSILAEAVTNARGGARFHARSAGSDPAGAVHPLTLKYLEAEGLPVEGLCSQSWHEHRNWQPDAVITLCDQAAGEACPLWLGDALRIHWPLPDPSRLEGDDEAIGNAFRDIIHTLERRITVLLDLKIDTAATAEIPALFAHAERA